MTRAVVIIGDRTIGNAIADGALAKQINDLQMQVEFKKHTSSRYWRAKIKQAERKYGCTSPLEHIYDKIIMPWAVICYFLNRSFEKFWGVKIL